MPKVLAVNDGVKNLKFIKDSLASTGYEVTVAQDCFKGWTELERNSQEIEVVLIGSTISSMGGIQLLEKIKTHNEMAIIPVIMQTDTTSKKHILEGIKAGAYYHLSKPHDASVLISIVDAAIANYKERVALRSEINLIRKSISFIESGSFTFRTLEDAYDLTPFLAKFFPEPEKVTIGITELLVNAVEHGNLCISYEEKTSLRNDERWEEEVKIRQEMPDNIRKKVRVSYKKTNSEITLLIVDEGKGFDWKKYIEISPGRELDNHGRGIVMSMMMSFDSVEYRGTGNKVLCKVKL